MCTSARAREYSELCSYTARLYSHNWNSFSRHETLNCWAANRFATAIDELNYAHSQRIKLKVKSAGFAVVAIICRFHGGTLGVHDVRKMSGDNSRRMKKKSTCDRWVFTFRGNDAARCFSLNLPSSSTFFLFFTPQQISCNFCLRIFCFSISSQVNYFLVY